MKVINAIASDTGEVIAIEKDLGIPGAVTPVALELPENLSYDEWEMVGSKLKSIEGSILWWVGDWLNFGERKYGETYSQALDATEKNYQTLADAKWVAGRFGFSFRNENLSWSHHRVAAGEENPTRWLDLAEKEGWTKEDLRRQIQLSRRDSRLIEIGTPAFADLRYPIILADPPWRYEHPSIGSVSRAIENHYPTMTLEEICALPISTHVATSDALLYLWATSPKLAECMKVIEAWGFEYRTDMVWDKEIIGMGYHARNQHETLLIAKRGQIPPPAAGTQPSSVYRERRGEHSAKPDFYYEMIEAAYPQLPKIELFSRSPRKGWKAWGKEAVADADAA